MKRANKKPLTSETLTVGAFDAKTNLSQLLDQVEDGKTIVITRHGRAVARLVPFDEPFSEEKKARIAKAIEVIERIGKGKSLDGVSIKSLIEEGRRF
jgi:prevent-host-death family protein